MTTRDVRAAAEPAKLKLVQGIVNKGTRDSQLRTARCAQHPTGPEGAPARLETPAQAGSRRGGPVRV